MTSPKLGTPDDLRRVYAVGALSRTETMTNCSVYGDDDYPVHLVVKGARGEERYEFWTHEVHTVLDEALNRGDTRDKNPNLPVLQQVFARMVDIRERLGQAPYVPKRPVMPEHIKHLIGLS